MQLKSSDIIKMEERIKLKQNNASESQSDRAQVITQD